MPKADFACQAMTVSQIISGFNPAWDSKKSSDEAFCEAVNFAEKILDNVIENACSKARAKAMVDEAIANTQGKIMVLDQFMPWQDWLFSSSLENSTKIEFVVFSSNRGGYNWQCVPSCPYGKDQRHPVPQEWRGLSGKELQEVTGVTTATFCHPAGFIGGAETREDAIRLAEIASESEIK